MTSGVAAPAAPELTLDDAAGPGCPPSDQPLESACGEARGLEGPSLVIYVFGQPAPQGSKRHVGNGVMIESSKKVKPWRQDVVAAARDAMPDIGWQAFDGPLTVRMVFSFTRPKSHYRTGRNAHLLKADAPAQPCSIPDLSKLARSTEDALTTARIWADDARVSEYSRLAKVWVDEDAEALATTGCRIEIRRVGP